MIIPKTDNTITIAPDLYLRMATPDDAQALFNIINSQRPYLREWLPFVDLTRQVSDTAFYLQTIVNSTSDRVFVIVSEEVVCGLIGFKGIEYFNRKVEIGYWLSEHQQGKGIMRQSCSRLLKYAFEILNMNRVQLKVAPKNYKSRNIPIKLGFTLEGTEREGELLNGHYHDLEVYSLLKKEWLAQAAK
ncbi:GNAT family N-acetyltransferase [Pontibacter sp. BT310]|uniref:GNAT family N-acetyltransferase n=1 Tax=Pontibacter populi TaxID=890055 RepID=A0ABS6X664_9BACT|nr:MULTISPECIES: GNAT family protein [Pontibacter]MBJ6116634.1 GNAT family N-acetyltransferase [Pontibacter sp. BT310]MBR0569058.1 GNAT family N-acetyltransferase [Microvirga sp. STS03]MBW3363488.1 GNAT family N-acetyltransferase [Pontibacter populi]